MPRNGNKKVVIVTGPTATGKTAMAISLAKHFHTSIISADSRQCFKELNIGVARPSVEELQEVHHYFIASHSIHDEVNASVFEQYALEIVNELFKKSDTVVMAGGTGLYIKAFCEGLDQIPEVPAHIRSEIISRYRENGLGWLQEEIKKKDPAFYAAGEIQNPQRMMRALEVFEANGRSVLDYRTGNNAARDFSIIKIGLELSREQLYNNINRRVDKMMENNLLEEVKGLMPFKRLNALQTVGYSEIIDYLEGNIILERAVESIKTNTRHYAKRQLTWFRKDDEIRWVAPGDTRTMISIAEADNKKTD